MTAYLKRLLCAGYALESLQSLALAENDGQGEEPKLKEVSGHKLGQITGIDMKRKLY